METERTLPVTNASLTDDERRFFAQAARQKRNELLAVTDYLFTPKDRPEPSNAQEWRTYRQALRDISQQPEFPAQIIWPTQP